MNNTHAFAAIGIALSLTIAGCGGGGAGREEPPLAGARIGGAFTMADQDGRTVTDASYAGKYRVMYFGYTYCPDVCPLDVQKLMQGYRAFAAKDPGRGARVQPIFVSVDPARDTPAVVKQFVGAFGPGLVGLTGSAAQLAEMAKRYAVAYSKQQTPGASGYLMNHSRMAVLFAPDGKPVALVRADEGAESVAADLDRWVV
ncbi:MAG TPA: SCO family protein [Sphingomonas sp.]|jgi:protein SCO1/2|uniref:SCO family protein n=1 Tax=Sphingomonas sp. TaxID=28214 RepID=UPI002EDB9773